VPIEPVWLCPIQLRPDGPRAPTEATEATDAPPWPLYPMRRDERYVNVGFWSTVPVEPGARDGDVNRRIEAEVTRLGGHKSLYSDAYYDRETFDRLYGVANQRRVKQHTDPDNRLTSLYEKAVNRR
jgi:FAD/FMN-containing dehydrogenase